MIPGSEDAFEEPIRLLKGSERVHAAVVGGRRFGPFRSDDDAKSWTDYVTLGRRTVATACEVHQDEFP